MGRSMGRTRPVGGRRVAEVRIKLAGICGAILSVFCLLALAAGPAAAAGVTATTASPYNVTSQTATLTGVYSNPGGDTGYSYYFEYGTTTAYGQQTPQSPSRVVVAAASRRRYRI